MADGEIIELYWARSEKAITETANKYSKYCYFIASNILQNNEDSEECVNDTYLKVWNAIPPKRPERLSAFIGRITRNLSLHKYEKNHAQKRGSGQVEMVLEELQECIPGTTSVEQRIDDTALVELLNEFLANLPKNVRTVFIRRYWYLSSIKEIAKDYKYTESKVKMTLLRTRNELKQILEKEGIIV